VYLVAVIPLGNLNFSDYPGLEWVWALVKLNFVVGSGGHFDDAFARFERYLTTTDVHFLAGSVCFRD